MSSLITASIICLGVFVLGLIIWRIIGDYYFIDYETYVSIRNGWLYIGLWTFSILVAVFAIILYIGD